MPACLPPRSHRCRMLREARQIAWAQSRIGADRGDPVALAATVAAARQHDLAARAAGYASGTGGSATSIRPSDDPDRVVAEAADAGQPARLGLLAGRVHLRLAAGRRPGRVVAAVRVEAAGRRHLDRVAGRQVEAAVVERAGDHAAVELADRQRRAHVRAAIVGRDDPGRRVGEQDVQVATRHPPHRPRAAAIGDVEHRLERRVGRAGRLEVRRGTGRVAGPWPASYAAGHEQRPRCGTTGAVGREEEERGSVGGGGARPGEPARDSATARPSAAGTREPRRCASGAGSP